VPQKRGGKISEMKTNYQKIEWIKAKLKELDEWEQNESNIQERWESTTSQQGEWYAESCSNEAQDMVEALTVEIGEAITIREKVTA
jgi:hypothetical protein